MQSWWRCRKKNVLAFEVRLYELYGCISIVTTRTLSGFCFILIIKRCLAKALQPYIRLVWPFCVYGAFTSCRCNNCCKTVELICMQPGSSMKRWTVICISQSAVKKVHRTAYITNLRMTLRMSFREDESRKEFERYHLQLMWSSQGSPSFFIRRKRR